MLKLKNEKGVSLVGVLMASALVGGLFLMVAKLMENSSKAIRTTEIGLEAQDFRALIEDNFRDETACTRTLGKALNSAIPPVTIRDGFAPGADNILETNGIFNADGDVLWKINEVVIGGLRLRSLTVPAQKIKPDGSIAPNYTSMNSSLNKGFIEVHMDLEKTGKAIKSYGGRSKKLKLYLSVEVYNDTGVSSTSDLKIKRCQLSGSPTPSILSIKVIEDGSGYDGQSGEAACNSIGKKCSRVMSHNFPSDDPSGQHTHGVRICETSYNQSLIGVVNGSWKNNVHDCSALIGNYTTYLHSGVLRCNATFYAICY